MTTINHLDELASFLGPEEVTFISQDDKAKIPVGLPAVAKQVPLLMHMEYRVQLPDHTFVLANGHKITPSVYGFCEVKPNGGGDRSAVGYSGPTFAAIRSSKHSSSTAMSHARDIETIYGKAEFREFTHTTTNGVTLPKPVLIFPFPNFSFVNFWGGPDENSRYDKVITMNVHHFVKLDLDALFVACNAPGRSAYNRVERRMAPLSKALAGIIFMHDHYGNHLDSQGLTIDTELEKTNFSYAGIALAEVWSEMTIDGHFTIAD
ncbi:hypothetical protein Bhyg_12406 [Pseudolycoriella hygida]|uniref:Uncharacterized protein n=1 Tax=Pseudolycoriella hygida TaxID=35572 RepID=A0A9Q0MY73_9DIPT|nr:hypothetical protein Bhyg_12406 [Pseudolycoriella hygida]